MGTYYVQQGQVVAFIGILVGLLCVVGAKISFLDGVQQDPGGSAVSVRDGKMMYLPFIKVVIPPEPCGPPTGLNMIRDGTCLPRGACMTKRGQPNGDCSLGFGECCRLFANCTTDIHRIDIDEYVTVLRSPEPATTQCAFKIRKKKDVCQVRLDFKVFSGFSSANNDGVCDRDRLQISNSITVPDGFTTCGNLADQHMYLSFGSSDSIDILPRVLSTNARYEIVMSQIPCLSNRVVPSYCLQYFNQSTAIVKSFDWPTQQQSNQQTDWVDINGEQRHCASFPMVHSIWKPYLLNVNFDQREVPIPPFGASPGVATDGPSCLAIGTGSRGILICEWFPEPTPANVNGTCQCDLNPTLIVPGLDPGIFLGPPPDVGNTGFCLRYEV
ncbi:hypothetical protein Fcan01_14172 [Folsomia candida]|uniref:CUB domain-containing protein n=1 Tax=Folsomia candida TaxID=158441 RepID=A0A226E0Q0_FOLCA|nr:hypothetical protein Fcan01_14172 [Folsomia candida]